LKLFDERTGTWHDYSKRAGKEVVFGKTIGPAGTPERLLDPATLWNEVEKAEPRSTSQIGRDYRIPIPRGLNKDAAVAMSMAMAGYLVSRFQVPVSVGVHRDNDVDLDGNQKPAAMIGYHAHLYFPTRQLVREGDGEGATWWLGEKLSDLSNKRTSAALVDDMNAKWAALANRFAQKAGLSERFESKSYVRLGLDITPKNVRARRFGKKNKWYPTKAATTPALNMDPHAVRARLHARRAASAGQAAKGAVVRAKRASSRPVKGKAPLVNRVSFVGGRTLRLDSHMRLAELMRRAGPVPTNDSQQAALERSMFLADFIESLLFAQERGRQAQGDFEMAMLREDLAQSDARVRKDILDGELRRAEAALERWLRMHPLKARFNVPSDEYSILVSHRNATSTQLARLQGTIAKRATTASALVQARDVEVGLEERARLQIVDAMQAYKPDFRTVVQALSAHLDDVQRADVAALADALGIDVLDVMSPARAEAAFVSPRKNNP
jgi:hypothetical protein